MEEDGEAALPTLSFPNPAEKLAFTGERYVSGLSGQIQHEHFHRYLFAAPYCSGRDVLDIACGEGYGCHLLAQVAGRVVGVDIDAEMIAYTNRQYASGRLSFVAGDATAIPLESASFDVVTSFETIEHFQDHERFLAEVARVLRPGGLLIISSPNRPVYSEQANHENHFHVRELDREEFRAALLTQFAHVALFEQRPMQGSAIVAEGAVPLATEGLETSDHLTYRRSEGVPSTRYFVALASVNPLPLLNNSLLYDSTPAEAPAESAAQADMSPDTLAAQLAAAQAELEAVTERAERAERQVATLRTSHAQWAAEAAKAEVAARAEATKAEAAKAEQVSVAAPVRPSLRTRVSMRWWLNRLRTALTVRRRRRARREFDAAFYLRQNPDVAATGMDPFQHYLWTGWREGRDPNPGFSTAYYLQSNEDVRASEVNPFVHYVTRGRMEGRRAHPLESDEPGFVRTQVTRVPLLAAPPPPTRPVRTIAFYLPQFHAIPENNEWWGQGFTEWTNVRSGKPQFEGHYQPRVPGELGYYNLLEPGIQHRQVELAKLYGIEGFCFYFYWFGGKRLLEKPLENWLRDKSLDLPFCLCWANENWTRRWDGLEKEILIAQKHSAEDDLAFIAEAAPYLRDPRYIRVDGKPLLVVYRPSLLPSASRTAARWRTWCRDNGIGEIHLAYTQSFEHIDPKEYGFDAAIEFPPNNSRPPDVTRAVTPLRHDFGTRVYDWRILNERSKDYADPAYRLYRSVCPGWDNTARRKNGGTAFVNNTPELYRGWMENAAEDTIRRFAEPSQRLVFVNAWNEWAEGAHLEPDSRFGYAWLQATRDALENVTARSAKRKRIVIVSHDAHPHGAQYLALHMARGFRELGLETDMIALGDGPLLPRFAEVATVHRLDMHEPKAALLERLSFLRRDGADVAIANTTVSGLMVPLLKQAGFKTVSLVHELPGVLNDYRLKEHARAIAAHADKVVFAAQMVRDGFEAFAGQELPQAVIRPQGLLRRNPFKGRQREARRAVCERHGLPPDTRLIVSVGFVDERKGPDLFVEAAQKVLATHPDAAFIWVGHPDRATQSKIDALLQAKKLGDRVKFVGFVAEPMDYYAAASAYALTSREDPFPNVVLEAAEVSVPVVAFEGATGAADFVLERGGRLARAFDTDDFAAKLGELLSIPSPPDFGPVGSLRQYLLDLLHHATGLPRVSVIVPNFNYAKYLPERLASIAAQTLPIYELFILDDASTDGSADLIRAFLAGPHGADGELTINTRNSGSVFRQWQKGLARCGGDLVWIAEADDVAEPSFLAQLVPAFDDLATVMAFSQSRQIDGRGTELAPDYLNYTGDISDAWRGDYTNPGIAEIADALAVKNTIPNVSAVLFQRHALQQAFAGLGDRLFDYHVAGDWLLYMQTLRQGNIRFVASTLNSHRRHSASVTTSGIAIRHLEEVAEAQQIAAAIAPISSATRHKADAWRKHVRRHLKLPDEDLHSGAR